MAYEIDFLPVGDGERSGDAIALRHVDQHGNQRVIVIDGGTKDSGQSLVEHIRAHYETNTVDFVINTHADADHASGLTVVLEEMDVKNLIMHKPWDHANAVCDIIEKDINPATAERKLIKSLRNAKELEKIANAKGIPIHEPFQGLATQDGFLHVLGPTPQYYQQLLTEIIDEATNPLSKWLALGQRSVQRIVTKVRETLEAGTLVDPGDEETSPSNNASAIVLFNLDGNKILFTGDAGVPALTLATDYAEGLNIPLTDLKLLDVPHHGSKHNVGPTILKRIQAELAYISAAAQSEKHPSKKVCNELMRNASKVSSTKGRIIYHFNGFNMRPGWEPLVPLPFFEEVED